MADGMQARNPWMIASIALGAVLLVSLILNGYFIGRGTPAAGDGFGTGKVVAPAAGQDGSQQAAAPVLPAAGDSPSIGSASAPVTIIEFSDFQCPFCGMWENQTWPELKKNYVDTGKVRLVYKEFPLPIHPLAGPASLAAQCADEQGRFWEYHDKLFADQEQLSEQNLKLWAQQLGLDAQRFDTCLSTQATLSKVQRDLQEGQAAGVDGTPTFFVNGKEIVGAQPYPAFQQAIDAAIAGSK